LKVEATKFTEVGYVGREVDSIIRDLAESAIKLTREQEMAKVNRRAEDLAEEAILDALLPQARDTDPFASNTKTEDSSTRQKFRKMLLEGKLEDKEIDIEISSPSMGMEILGPQGMNEMTDQLSEMMKGFSKQQKKTRKVTVKEAKKLLIDEMRLTKLLAAVVAVNHQMSREKVFSVICCH